MCPPTPHPPVGPWCGGVEGKLGGLQVVGENCMFAPPLTLASSCPLSRQCWHVTSTHFQTVKVGGCCPMVTLGHRGTVLNQSELPFGRTWPTAMVVALLCVDPPQSHETGTVRGLRWHNLPRERKGKEGGKGRQAEGGHKVGRGRWAPPPTDGKSSRKGQGQVARG